MDIEIAVPAGRVPAGTILRSDGATVCSSLDGHDLSSATFQRQPNLTADALLRCAVEGGERMPARLQGDLLTAMGTRGRWAYGFLTGPAMGVCAGVTLPHVASVGRWWEVYADALAEGDPGPLLSALAMAFDNRALHAWQPVLDDPRHWFARLAEAVRRCGPLLDTVWRQARPQLDVEEARFEVAMRAASGLAAFVNAASEDLIMSDTELLSPGIVDLRLRFRGELIVAPQVSPTRAHVVLDHHSNLWTAYPLAMARRAPERDQLAVVLGPARAALLRALDHPRTMGQLADQLTYAPSTLTHHANKLLASGLVTHVRDGKHVWLHRTHAANVLIEVLAT